MQRRLEPELLDALPVVDPRAIGSRRDLERLNAWMRHAAILARLLHEGLNGSALRHIAELGAGDGKFMFSVASRVARRWPGVAVRLLDWQDAMQADTRNAFRALTWNAALVITDVFQGLEQLLEESCQVMVANLFLHHFTASQLGELFAAIGERIELFIALEPNRSLFTLAFSQWVRVIGCNEITQHDAPISVRAGFAGKELSQLWPNADRWRLREESVGLFSHLFLAQRRESTARG
jgi:hypothetical protein